MTSASTGTVAEIWRFPVKSMGGERLEAGTIGAAGLIGDRAFAVVGVEDGAVATAKFPRRWAGLLGFSARYVAEPEAGARLPPVVVRFPDGSVLRSDDETVHLALSEVLGREVILRAGGPFVDLAAAHVLSSASLASAGTLVGETVDVRRFRPNLLLDVTHDAVGYPEDDWIDRPLVLGTDGAGPVLRATLPAPRCVMTTLAQPDLPAHPRVLAALTREHRLVAGEYGVRPCLGVYADVTAVGAVREGDTWQVTGEAS